MSDRKDASKRKRRGTGPGEGRRGERAVVLKKQVRAKVEDGRRRPCWFPRSNRGGRPHSARGHQHISQAAPLDLRREQQCIVLEIIGVASTAAVMFNGQRMSFSICHSGLTASRGLAAEGWWELTGHWDMLCCAMISIWHARTVKCLQPYSHRSMQ